MDLPMKHGDVGQVMLVYQRVFEFIASGVHILYIIEYLYLYFYNIFIYILYIYIYIYIVILYIPIQSITYNTYTIQVKYE